MKYKKERKKVKRKHIQLVNKNSMNNYLLSLHTRHIPMRLSHTPFSITICSVNKCRRETNKETKENNCSECACVMMRDRERQMRNVYINVFDRYIHVYENERIHSNLLVIMIRHIFVADVDFDFSLDGYSPRLMFDYNYN